MRMSNHDRRPAEEPSQDRPIGHCAEKDDATLFSPQARTQRSGATLAADAAREYERRDVAMLEKRLNQTIPVFVPIVIGDREHECVTTKVAYASELRWWQMRRST